MQNKDFVISDPTLIAPLPTGCAVSRLDDWRETGRQILQRNFEVFRGLVSETERLVRRRCYDQAAISASFAAYHAQIQHSGLFFSPALERALLRLGRDTIDIPAGPPRPAWSGSCPARILSVSTNASVVSGIPRMLRRWLQQDGSRSHAVALTKQAPDEVPAALQEIVAARGGQIHVLNAARGGLVARARELRRIAAQADLVVLHVWEQDVVPILAFADKANSPPVIYVNHGDHCFWLGVGIADVVANLRQSGRELCVARRAVEMERNMLLPTALEPLQRGICRAEAKRALGLPAESLLLLSIARAPKYKTLGPMNFADAHVPVLQRHPNAMLIVVGVGQREDWAEAIRQTGGRIRTCEATEDTGLYYQAADIYVDSSPFPSTTSLLEAGSYGLPLVSRMPFSEASGILGADMPGLEGSLVVARDVLEYTDALSRLIQDERFRLDLGERTCQGIRAKHCGAGWQSSLEEVYARACTLPRRGDILEQAEQCSLAEPDAYLPIVHGGAYHPEWIVYFNLGAMPLLRRVRCWTALWRRGGKRPRWDYLLPEWLRERYWSRRRKLGRFCRALQRHLMETLPLKRPRASRGLHGGET